jgi:hypothetical protein
MSESESLSPIAVILDDARCSFGFRLGDLVLLRFSMRSITFFVTVTPATAPIIATAPASIRGRAANIISTELRVSEEFLRK